MQRAAVVGIALAVTQPWLGWELAVSAAVAALLVGMLDLRQNPADRLRTMGLGTLTLAVTTLVTRLLSPWPVTIVLLLAALAFAEGAGIAVHRDAPVLFQLNGIVAATALLDPQPRSGALPAAVVVLVAGSAQTLVSVVVARRRRVVRELDLAAAAIDHVGAFLHHLAAPPTGGRDADLAVAMERAARSLSGAEHAISVSDLTEKTLTPLRRATFAADQLRVEGQVLVTMRQHRQLSAEADAVRRQRMAGLEDVLHRGAVGLYRRSTDHRRDIALLDQALARLGARTLGTGTVTAEPDPDTRVATAGARATPAPFADPAWTFAAAVRELLGAGRWERAPVTTSAERRASVRAAARTDGLAFRFGLRTAVAALVAGLAGSAFTLAHASWSVNATLSVLRPDGGGIVPRFVLRAGATALAAGLVVAEVALVGGNHVALAMLAVLFAGLMFWLGPINYGVYGLMVTVSVLGLIALTGEDPHALASARLIDTVVGSAIAVAVGLAIPVWKVTELPGQVAALCAAMAQRFTTLAWAVALAPNERDYASLRAAGIVTRDVGCEVLAIFDAASVEPVGRVPVARLRATVDDLRGCGRAAATAERLLADGQPASPTAAALARDTADTLDTLADAIRERRPAQLPARTAGHAGTEIDAVLDEAFGLADRAARLGWESDPAARR